MVDDTPYIKEPRGVKDLNINMLMLIQKVNHEQTTMNKDIHKTNKKVGQMSDSLKTIATGFATHITTSEANGRMLKWILAIIGGVSALIGIGAFISGF